MATKKTTKKTLAPAKVKALTAQLEKCTQAFAAANAQARLMLKQARGVLGKTDLQDLEDFMETSDDNAVDFVELLGAALEEQSGAADTAR